MRLEIGPPSVSDEKLALFSRFHADRTNTRGWPPHDETALGYGESFVDNPISTEEWSFLIQDRLVGLGFVDVLPEGLSAIYFVHDPEERRRSLGIWNILSLLDEARRRELPHVYLGYYIAGCQSMSYKARFQPGEILGSDGCWRKFGST